jgi:hypothetical protein
MPEAKFVHVVRDALGRGSCLVMVTAEQKVLGHRPFLVLANTRSQARCWSLILTVVARSRTSSHVPAIWTEPRASRSVESRLGHT